MVVHNNLLFAIIGKYHGDFVSLQKLKSISLLTELIIMVQVRYKLPPSVLKSWTSVSGHGWKGSK